MKDTRRPLSLLVALSAFVLCQASQVRDVRPNLEQEVQPKTSLPIDLLGLAANEDVAVMFGLRLFNDIHTRMAQCREDRRKIEAKYSNDSRRVQQYYAEAERVIQKARPLFEELVHENSQDIEANFKKAFRELDKSRDKKLKRLEARCSQAMDSFMDARLHEAVVYAETLIVQDPAAFTKLTFDVSAYATHLRGVLPMCSHGNRPHPPPSQETMDPNSNGGMNFDLCYVREVQQIISFIDHFLAQADELRQRYYGDDEDFYDVIDDKEERLSGDFQEDGFEPEFKKPPPTQTPATNVRPTVQETINVPISGFFEPGSVILGKPKPEKPHDGKDHDKKPNSTEETPSRKPANDSTPPIPINDLLQPGPVIIETEKNESLPPTKETPSDMKPTEDQPPNSSTESKPDDEEVSDYENDKKESTTSPDEEEPTLTDTKPTHDDPEWLDEAFDDILGSEEDGENEDETDVDEKELKTPARSRSKSKSEENEEEGPHHHGNIDLNLPGVDVEIGSDGVNFETNIGQQGAGQFGGSIVFDDDTVHTTADSPEEEDNSFITYMLIYFFVTLGSLLLLTILVLTIAIVVLRMRSSRTPKDTPLLSEEEKIAVMKQTGYVNPTYKFFDVKEV